MRLLKHGYTDGMLSLETLDYRLGVTVRARTLEQLQALVADLPRPAGLWQAARRGLARTAALIDDLLVPSLVGTAVHTIELPPDLCCRARLVLGRSEGCDVVVAGPSVSRRHALLTPLPDGWGLRDLKSTNGTWIDGHRVARPHLRAGEAFGLGAESIRLVPAS